MNEEIENKLKELVLKSTIWKNGRRYIYGIPFSRIVWNMYNPNNQVKKGNKYVIHHKDENILNDNINNLEKLSLKEHNLIHNKGKILSKETKKKIGLGSKNRKFTKIHREKISNAIKGEKNGMFGKVYSKEERERISLKLKGRKFSEETRRKISEKNKGRKITSKEELQKMSERAKKSWEKRRLNSNKKEGGKTCQI